MVKRKNNLNDIADDVDDLQDDIGSVDKKLWLLIGLWILDKVIMALLIIMLNN